MALALLSRTVTSSSLCCHRDTAQSLHFPNIWPCSSRAEICADVTIYSTGLCSLCMSYAYSSRNTALLGFIAALPYVLVLIRGSFGTVFPLTRWVLGNEEKIQSQHIYCRFFAHGISFIGLVANLNPLSILNLIVRLKHFAQSHDFTKKGFPGRYSEQHVTSQCLAHLLGLWK